MGWFILVDNGDFHLGTTSGFAGNGLTRMDGLTTVGASVYRPVQGASMVVTDTAAFQRYPDGDGLVLRGVVFRNDGSTWYGVQVGQQMAYYPLTQLNVTTEVRYDSIKTTSVKEKITGLDTHIYKIQGYPEKDKKLTKTLDLCGKNGDTFMVNAWGRGDALPESTDKNRRFGVEVIFVGKDKDGKEVTDVHYTNFSPDILDWQFLSDVYVAKIAYTSVKVSYTYCRNANLAFFDGLSLFKEGFGQTFTYDKDNNIIAVTDLQNQKQKFEYNDNLDMTGVTDAKGNSFKYEYDKNHNVTKGTSAEKRILRYTYDDKGNVLKSAAVSPEDETAGTWMTRTMTDDKNHVAAVKDARGYQVTYAWDTKKDLLNSVKDARNSTTFYTYDAKTERLTSVSKTVKAKGQDQEVKVEYGYSNDRLTRITHNGFNRVKQAAKRIENIRFA